MWENTNYFFWAFLKTVFVIILCNNHLIEQIEAYVSWLFERTPAVAGILNGFLRQLEKAKKSYNDNDNNGLPGIQKVSECFILDNIPNKEKNTQTSPLPFQNL